MGMGTSRRIEHACHHPGDFQMDACHVRLLLAGYSLFGRRHRRARRCRSPVEQSGCTAIDLSIEHVGTRLVAGQSCVVG